MAAAAAAGLPITGNNVRIARLRNRFRGRRCFVIGNGPSLVPGDLDLLSEEFTFASNKIYKLFSRTRWRPSCYLVVDEVILRQNLEDIDRVEAGLRLGLACYRDLMRADVYFNNNLGGEKAERFSRNVMHTLRSSGTVSFQLLQIAFHMGFAEVYLLGHDYNFAGAISRVDGLERTIGAPGGRLHFDDEYFREGERPAGQDPRGMYRGMEEARRVFEEDGRRILNASRSSCLDVFERCDLETVIGRRREV